MADASGIAQAILGNQQVTPLQNPTDIMTKWQQLKNMKQQGANMELQHRTGEQALASTMADRGAKVLFSLNQLGDNEIAQGTSDAIDRERQSGLLDDKAYASYKQQLAATGGDPKKIRQMVTSVLATTMAGPEAAKYLLGTPTRIDNGPQFSGGVEGGIGGQNPGALMPNGPTITKGLAPQIYNNGGNSSVWAGNGPAGPAVAHTMSPGFANAGDADVGFDQYGHKTGAVIQHNLSPGQSIQPMQYQKQNPDGSYSFITGTAGQLNPGVAASGTKGAGNGPLGSGNYQPPTANVPMGTEQSVQANVKAYQEDTQKVPQLVTGTQSLQKALTALNLVATGTGTEGLAKMRAYAQSLGNVLGINTGNVNIQDMNRAELEKYLTDYARQSSSAGRSDEALGAAFKSNASGSINNAAAQDVVRTNIGRDRQQAAAAMSAQNAQNYNEAKAKFMTTTDPRGFAWDSYTESQKQKILGEVGKPGSEGYKKLMRAIGAAKAHNLLDPAYQLPENVNQSPETPSAVPQPNIQPQPTKKGPLA